MTMTTIVRGLVCCALLGACATEEANLCDDPTGLYRATVKWMSPTCTTPATTVQFLIKARESYDLWWEIEFSPWNAKGELDAVSGPGGCRQLDFHTDVGTAGTASEHFDGYILALDGKLLSTQTDGGGVREVGGTTPCRGEFTFEYVVKEQ
jgi:hypothetical protein